MRRNLFPSNYAAIIAYIFTMSPYVCCAISAFKEKWWIVFFSPLLSYVLYATIWHWFTFRVISIKNGHLFASPDFTPIKPIQHKCRVDLSAVIIADFGYIQGDSRGRPIFRAWDIPCLLLTLADGTIEKIVLCGYSKRQITKIENLLHEENAEILFDHHSERLTRRW